MTSKNMAVSAQLRAALAARYSERAGERWRRFVAQQEVDWEALVAEATAASLAPLLYDVLKRPAAPTVPSPTLEALHRRYLQSALHNTLAMRELAAVLADLTGAAIPVIVLKGAALAQLAYGNVALRPMVDLDLLLPFEAVATACWRLQALGFTSNYPFPFDDKSGLCWNEILLTKPGLKPVYLELHWNLLDNPYYARRLPWSELWEKSLPVAIEGTAVHILAPDHQILHLCAHNLFHHQGQVVQAGLDIAQICQQFGRDIYWHRLLETARMCDFSLALKTTLLPAAGDWYLPLPEEILTAVTALQTRRRENFFALSQRSEFLKYLRTLITLPGWWLKLRYVWGQLFPNRDYMAWRCDTKPSDWLPLAYLLRFGRGGYKLCAELLGRLAI